MRKAWFYPLLGLTLLLGVVLAAPAAQAVPVDVELVLAVDVSRSIDAEEFILQRQGYAGAFRNPQVLNAIGNGRYQSIAVCMVEWAGTQFQTIVVPWMLVKDAASAAAVSAAILKPERTGGNWTSISGGIDFSVPLFDNNGYEGVRRVIDVSGDGANNNGRAASMARDDAVAKGITINGLAIMNDRPNPTFGGRELIPLDKYYTENVIGGPDAFLIVAEDFSDFTRAVSTKLVREIAGRPQGRFAQSPIRAIPAKANGRPISWTGRRAAD